jgi:hypothetical protein
MCHGAMSGGESGMATTRLMKEILNGVTRVSACR